MDSCLLIGNGINRCCGGMSWESLLSKIAKNYFTSKDTIESSTLAFEQLRCTVLSKNIKLASENFAFDILKELDSLERSSYEGIYSSFLELPIKNILTTNFDYAIERTLIKDYQYDKYIDDSDDEYIGADSWKNIVSIKEFYETLIGIDKTGHVFVAYKKGTRSDDKFSVGSYWEDIQKVCWLSDTIIGIKSDSTLEVAYTSDANKNIDAAVLNYADVVDVVYSSPYLAVLHKDGSISMELVASYGCKEEHVEKVKAYYDDVVEEITTWNGIVALYYGAGGYFGIRYDGTVKYVSDDISVDSYDQNADIKSEVEAWENIVWVDTSEDYAYAHWNYAVGLKTDGTVVSTGDGEFYRTEKNANGNGYHGVLHSGGTYNDVSAWKLW